jgi:error-prone DNA polymerase
MGYYPPRVLTADARRSGVKVLPPDVNRSLDHYSVEKGAIRISLNQVKGIATETVQSILHERTKAKFTSLRDFALRTNTGFPMLEKLLKVGAFDSLGSRRALSLELNSLERLKHRSCASSLSLFENATSATDATTTACHQKKTDMLVERELLSLDLSAHPLDFYHLPSDFTRIKDLRTLAAGETVKIAGSVIRYQTPPTRNGNRVVYVILEDGTGVADITVFSNVQERYGHVLFRAGWIVAKGKIQRRGPGSLSIIAQELYPLDSCVHSH